MRPLVASLFVASLALATAAGSAPAPLWPERAEDLTLSFVAVEGVAYGGASAVASLALGPLSAASSRGAREEVVVRRRLAIRLDSPSGAVAMAGLSAFLASETPGTTVRVDGVPLSTVPRVLDPVHRVGTAVVHQIEISVPASAPEGPLLSTITWTAESR